MEMRSLTRCLRSRPTTTATTSLLSTRQSTLGQSQFVLARQTPQALRFSTSSPSSNANQPPRSNANQPPRPTRAQSLRTKPDANIDDILDQLNLSTNRRNRNRQTQQKTSQDASSADGAPGTGLAANEPISAPGSPQSRQDRRKVDLKLGPVLGREIPVAPERGRDLESSIKRLDRLLRDNNVRNQWIAQKHHVRRGQMKKNLRMTRWRKLFKYSFSHMVNKIQRMRRQGW
ncbi:hypothetical protein ASPSYDRAFT_89461 [Aspergillus sydowii CBS 593.65]|uniref:Ribosomal protein S21 n=1 Tax=Aspergillus sydowii CBS 593.65 TaxID=1036612 RepID=A0A1L9TH20_9EURO|nr:uncharacterized protein ASPSYDRAFT_89461 [Aspergillus sydowii CBS 593.65]OJJ58724.1 hypothetical protein ASPSYDRAFT_89461 [Aspergillus sydowii CBS 593.65]